LFLKPPSGDHPRSGGRRQVVIEAGAGRHCDAQQQSTHRHHERDHPPPQCASPVTRPRHRVEPAAAAAAVVALNRPHPFKCCRRRRCGELHTFRTQDLSFPRTKGPYGELSFPMNESSKNFRSRELSFSGTKVPWNFRSHALSFSGTFVPGERKFLSFLGPFVPGNFRSHYLLCVLNYCMFGCDFTLMMLTPL